MVHSDPATLDERRERCLRVRTLAASGFLFDPSLTRQFLADAWGHLYAWLRHDEPLPRQLAGILYHLQAFSRDAFAPQAIGVRMSRAEIEPLCRQVAEYLAEAVFQHLARNRAIEALLRRDYERGFASVEQPRELARLLGLLQVVDRYLPWPEATATPELVAHLETALARCDAPEFDRHPQASGQIVARVLAVLLPLYAGVHQQVLVPLAGSHPGVVQVTVAVALAGPRGGEAEERVTSATGLLPAMLIAASGAPAPGSASEPREAVAAAAAAGSSRRALVTHDAEVTWLGLPVSSDVRDGARDLLHAVAGLVPAGTPQVQRMHVFVSETSHRPLDRAVRLMAGRSWEAGGLLALLAALLGRRLAHTAVTGQVDPRTGAIEEVGGIEEKIEALHACRHPEHGPLTRRLLCPDSNVAAAERAARRLGWHELEVVGLSRVEQLPALAGVDPWQEYCQQLVAEAATAWPRLGLPARVREDWRRVLREYLDGEERVLVLPCPFGLDPLAWARQVAGWVAALRLDARRDAADGHGVPAARDAVPVVLPADPRAASFSELVAAGVAAVTGSRAGGGNGNDNGRGDGSAAAAAREQIWSNRFQSPDGFVFLHADPTNSSPLFDPPGQHLTLTRRHPALRHRFCFVAAHLHQLDAWRSHPLFARL